MTLSHMQWHIKPDAGGATDAFNSILVPRAGCLFGAETASPVSGTTYPAGSTLAGLNLWESISGVTNEIVSIYKTGDWGAGSASIPSTSELAMAVRAGKPRSILRYTWKPTGTWAQIAAGSANAQIDRVAAKIKLYPFKIFFGFWHEPEDNVNGGPSTPMGTAAQFVAAWEHVRDRMEAQGATNLVWVLNFMGFNNWRDLIPDMIPDLSSFDWFGNDPYMRGGQTAANLINDPVAPSWPGCYDFFQSVAPTKPIMWPEWGVDYGTRTDTQGAAAYDALGNLLQSDAPMIKAIIQWNGGGGDVEINARIQGKPLSEAAFRRLANHPYFHQVSTNLAP